MADIYRLSEDEVLNVRRRMATYTELAQKAFGQTEPLHPDRLASAVHRQNTGLLNDLKYKTVHDVGANLFYGVAMGHAFENGNKRTALVALLVFLDKNKWQLVDADDDDLYELARSMAAHEIVLPPGVARTDESEAAAVSSWLRLHTRHIVRGDFTLEWKELRATLLQQDCTFDKPAGNFITIRRNGFKVKTGYPGHSFSVPVGEVKRIRKQLGLDDIHGIDSASFYWLDARVDSAVAEYRNLMSRLADL